MPTPAPNGICAIVLSPMIQSLQQSLGQREFSLELLTMNFAAHIEHDIYDEG